jgi:diguanylate cyclase (GGDEF)-like protein
MSELPKIGVVYKTEQPHLFRDTALEQMPWRFEFFAENSILGVPVVPRLDFLAIFFSAEDVPSDIHNQLANIFPGAEIIGYQNSGDESTGNIKRRSDGLLIAYLPVPFSLIQHLLGNIEAIKTYKREMSYVRQRTEELQDFFDTFVNMVESAWNSNDRKLGMSLLTNKILDRLHAEECIVYLFNETGTTLHRAYTTGNIKDIDLFDYQANSSIVESVVNTGEPYINNHYTFEIKVPFSKDSLFVRSIMCLPLQRRGERLGVIELINKHDGAFTEEDRTSLEMLIGPLRVAIRTIDVFETSERLTITDDLTKLYNYRYLMQYLETEVKRCLRYKKKVSLLFVDIDGFKRINDTFGHLVGSQALSELGHVLRRMLRETDVVGRYGGDEFVIVLPETPLNGAMVIAERLRKKVEDYEFVAQNLSIRLTVSLGVANCPKHTLTAEGLIKKADAAMYRAKELSKNSIKVAV